MDEPAVPRRGPRTACLAGRPVDATAGRDGSCLLPATSAGKLPSKGARNKVAGNGSGTGQSSWEEDFKRPSREHRKAAAGCSTKRSSRCRTLPGKPPLGPPEWFGQPTNSPLAAHQKKGNRGTGDSGERASRHSLPGTGMLPDAFVPIGKENRQPQVSGKSFGSIHQGHFPCPSARYVLSGNPPPGAFRGLPEGRTCDGPMGSS